MYDTVIIRYGEIFLKSEFVRRGFEKALLEDLKFRLKKMGKKGIILRKRHRIYVKTDNAEEVADNLANVFGVVSTNPAIETRANLEDICNSALEFSKRIIRDNDRFAVRAERSGRHNFSSRDVEVLVGDKIRNSLNARVDLENPQKTIFVEIRDELAFVFDKKIAGVGGLPYGTQGRVIAMISDDVNSGIAAWMMMHRGCEIVAVHTKNSGGKILEKLGDYSYNRIKKYEIEDEESDKIYEILEDIAEKENAHGVVVGGDIGEFEKNIKLIKNIKIPIYYPLIGMEKGGIGKIERRIGF